MGVQKCPGQDRRFWNPEDISEVKCPVCSAPVELWKDEGITKCWRCGFEIRNPKVEFGCAQWCKFAVQCIGYKLQDGSEEISIRDRLISAIVDFLFPDKEKVMHTLRVLRWAEELAKNEGGSAITVKAVAILHEVWNMQKPSGSRVQKILEDIGLENTIRQQIYDMIRQFYLCSGLDTIEFRIFRDAHLLSELEENPDDWPSGDSESFIDNRFKTEYAKRLANELCSRF